MHVPIIGGGCRLAVGEDERNLPVLDGRALDLLSGLLRRSERSRQRRPTRTTRGLAHGCLPGSSVLLGDWIIDALTGVGGQVPARRATGGSGRSANVGNVHRADNVKRWAANLSARFGKFEKS